MHFKKSGRSDEAFQAKVSMQAHCKAMAYMEVHCNENFAGLPQNSASQKAAALSAIAALSRRLAGGGHGPPPATKDNDSGPP